MSSSVQPAGAMLPLIHSVVDCSAGVAVGDDTRPFGRPDLCRSELVLAGGNT